MIKLSRVLYYDRTEVVSTTGLQWRMAVFVLFQCYLEQLVQNNVCINFFTMVQAWFMAENWSGDQREEHHMQPPQFVELDTLFKLTLVEHFKVNESDPANDKLLNSIKKDRGYSYEDEITCSKECLPNYESKLKMFFEEHLHTDEEIRLVLEGSGYFDVRDGINDRWIRIKVEPGDLLIIPKGIYHRFTLDTNNFIKAKRFFVGEPVWTPHNRPADDMNCRKEYLNQIISC